MRPPERQQQAPALWVFSELYYPEETSTGYVMTRIAEALAERFPVRVLCAQPTYSARGTRAPRTEVHRGVHIRRAWSTTGSNEHMLPRVANLVTVTLSLFVHALLRLRRGDRVLVVTNPPVLPFAIALACLVRRASCVVLVQDTYPEVLVAAGVCRERSLLARALDRANRILYRFATRIVVVGRGMQERARAKLEPEHHEKVRVIRDWADTDLIPALPRAGSSMLEELGISDRLVVQFAGNISRLNDIETIVDAMERLTRDEVVHFLFVGRGGKRPWLEREIDRRSLKNVTLTGWRPRSETPEMHRACDVVLIPLIPGMAGVSVPSRLYNSLASGRPIIAMVGEQSELARVVAEERVGWVVPPGDAEGLTAAVRAAAESEGVRVEMGARSRQAAEARFSRDRAIQKWKELFDELG